MAETAPKDLVGFLDFYLVQKAPIQIPETGRELIVKIAPWICLILMLLSLPVLLVALGIGTALLPFAGAAYVPGFTFSVIFLIAYYGLMIASLPGLFARRAAGWRLAFYAELISIVHSAMIGAIIGAIVGGVIGLYLLFQVRTKYS